MTHVMVILQGFHSGDALRYPNISACVGLKSFCPWCLKMDSNMETIAIHLHKVHYQMGYCVPHLSEICQHECTECSGTLVRMQSKV